MLPPGAVQIQDEKTRIWAPQTLSGTPVQWVCAFRKHILCTQVLCMDYNKQIAILIKEATLEAWISKCMLSV